MSLCLVRLNPDGSQDRTFSPQLDLNYPRIWAIEFDGAMLLSAMEGGGERLWRLRADGSNDPVFAPVHLSLSRGNSSVKTVLLQPDRRILVAGRFDRVNGQPCGALLRLHSNGSIDPSFELWLNEFFGPVDHWNNSVGRILPSSGPGEYLLNIYQLERPSAQRVWLPTPSAPAILRFTSTWLPVLRSIDFSKAGARIQVSPGSFSNLVLGFSDNLRDWQPLPISLPPSPVQVTDPQSAPRRFYRAREK